MMWPKIQANYYVNMLIRKNGLCSVPQALSVRKSEFQGSLVLQSSNLETINRSADLSCTEGEGRRGCFSGTKYRFTELLSNGDVLQERDREQIPGKGKRRLRDANVNGTCFPLCTIVHMTSRYVTQVREHGCQAGHTLPSGQLELCF